MREGKPNSVKRMISLITSYRRNRATLDDLIKTLDLPSEQYRAFERGNAPISEKHLRSLVQHIRVPLSEEEIEILVAHMKKLPNNPEEWKGAAKQGRGKRRPATALRRLQDLLDEAQELGIDPREHLTPRGRKYLEHFYAGRTYKEIADLEGVSLSGAQLGLTGKKSSVTSHIWRAIEQKKKDPDGLGVTQQEVPAEMQGLAIELPKTHLKITVDGLAASPEELREAAEAIRFLRFKKAKY